MRRLYYYTHSFILMIALASLINYAQADDKKTSKSDTAKIVKVFTNRNDKSYLKNGIRIPLPSLKPNVTIYANKNDSRLTPTRFESYKLLSNVQVYPNPITDQINLRYYISKNTNVSIKVMDVLGNEVITLFSQRVDSGEQKFTFNLNNKLTSGFYFLRMVVGTESVIKRISIL